MVAPVMLLVVRVVLGPVIRCLVVVRVVGRCRRLVLVEGSPLLV